MLKGFDVAQDTTGRAHQIAALGYQAVGFYLRSDRCSLAMVKGLEVQGVRRISIWEKGKPTSVEYFASGAAKGRSDAIAAVSFAEHIGQPKGTQIFYCVDYDATDGDLKGCVREYMAAAQAATKAAGYLASVYGSGDTCQTFVNEGLAHAGWLAMSRGWGGYHTFLPRAAIVQHIGITVAGFSADSDDVNDEGVAW